MTTYYTVSGAPVTHSFGSSAYIRTEFTSIQTAFGTVNSEMITKGAIAGQAWTGNHTFPTQSANDNSTKAATTAYVDTGLALKANIASPTFTGIVTIPSGASISGYALLASPAFTGTPTAPTATTGTGTTQVATCAFVAATAFSAELPAQTGNAGKFVTTDGTNASWAFAGVSSVTTATTATTLTSTPTLLKITPASYGVTVTLPDATTCSVGGPLHIIDNRGVYPVRVCDSTGVLKAFVFAGVVSHISLDDNSTAAGVWAIENGELVGASAYSSTSAITSVTACIDIGSNRELILSNTYGIVYNRSANTFGTATLIRAAGGIFGAVLAATDKVLVTSCPASTAFEAVVLSISGNTITVNTAATATLSASSTTVGVGIDYLVAAGSSFVVSYRVSTPACQLRSMTISGTTVTIGSAVTPSGTKGDANNGPVIPIAIGSVVVAVSAETTNWYAQPYTASGSTLTLGTGVTVSGGTKTIKWVKLNGNGRIFAVVSDGTSGQICSVVTLTGTVCTQSSVVVNATVSDPADFLLVGSSKLLFLYSNTTGCNLVTDTAGTASKGTDLTLSNTSTHCALYANGTTAYVADNDSSSWQQLYALDCSGASPAISFAFNIQTSTSTGSTDWNNAFSNYAGSRSPRKLYGADFVRVCTSSATTISYDVGVNAGVPTASLRRPSQYPVGNGEPSFYRGRVASENWCATAKGMTKTECIP